jgi:hypothetical protein
MEKDLELAARMLKCTTVRRTLEVSGGTTTAYEFQHVQDRVMGQAFGLGIFNKSLVKILPDTNCLTKPLYGL